MSQFNVNRQWIFEHEYQTSTVLYRPDVDRIKERPIGQPAAQVVGALVAIEVSRVDIVGQSVDTIGD